MATRQQDRCSPTTESGLSAATFLNMIEIIKPQDKHKRIEQLIAEHMSISRSAAQQFLRRGWVKLNDQPCNKSTSVKPGDVIVIEVPDQQNLPDIPIIYQDNDMLVINKPSGVLSQARGNHDSEANLSQLLDIDLPRGGLVHRLDRDTSGVMVLAKSEVGYQNLQNQFSERIAQKQYLAIVEKPLNESPVMIDAPIVRHPKQAHRFQIHASGKQAQTELANSKIKSSHGVAIEAKPITGRTHQIRLHLAYCKRPIIGDQVYGRPSDGRMLLHAHKLALVMLDGQTKTFEAEIPEDMA